MRALPFTLALVASISAATSATAGADHPRADPRDLQRIGREQLDDAATR